MLLTAALWLGAPATWPTARIVLWAANCATLIFLYGSLRPFGTRSECQLALMPVVFFYAFAVNANFAHYSSETLSCTLISLCLYLLSIDGNGGRTAPARRFLLGLAAGSIPFAKLQAAPIALLLVVAALLQALRRRPGDPRGASGRRGAAVLCLGAAVMPGLILGAVAAGGAFADFWKSYILASVAYAGQERLPSKLKSVWYLFAAPSDFRYFTLGVLALIAVALGATHALRQPVEDRLRRPLVVIVAQCLLTLACIATAGKTFLHYTLLLVPPLGLLPGLAWFAAKEAPGARDSREIDRTRATRSNGDIVSSVGSRPIAPSSAPPPAASRRLSLAIVFALQAVMAARYIHAVETRVLPRGPAPVSHVARHILSVREPGDQLSVWGWVPAYHVETGLIPATRDAVGHFVVSAGPYQDYFRRRHLADLERSRPVFFVDAVATGMFGWGWGDGDKHESFPALARFVSENYRLWKSVPSTEEGTPVRIYRLEPQAARLGPDATGPDLRRHGP
jgi:hypothetical protein